MRGKRCVMQLTDGFFNLDYTWQKQVDVELWLSKF